MATIERDQVRIRLAGRGSQGIMLGGTILAEAAVIDGLMVAEIQEFGPEARLGAAKADLIISKGQIAFPVVHQADFLLCLSRPAYVRYSTTLSMNGLMIAEETLREEMGDSFRVTYIPFRAAALELGKELYSNIIGLGALAALSNAVTKESLQNAVRARVETETLTENLAALDIGYELGYKQVPQQIGSRWANAAR
ncbi:MAG: 2-oxoacid:ferredoxin oxidoreductase subunit gamma [Acidimicrobiaceae bacterium]|nr:2-oxoacid:ferredoxin oxidoreductase subunit gamma [Acidimicrobiaceae bacterium]